MPDRKLNPHADAHRLYPNLAPLIEAALPEAAAPQQSARAIWRSAGGFYTVGSTRRILALFTRAGLLERQTLPQPSGAPMHVYRRTSTLLEGMAA